MANRKTILTVLAAVSLMSFTTSLYSPIVHADSLVQEQKTESIVTTSLPSKVGETTVQQFVLPDGRVGKVEVRKISDDTTSPFRSIRWYSERANNGSYFVNAYVGAGYAGFHINVHSNNITRAYDPEYFFAGVSVTGNLSHESSKQVTYYMDFQAPTPWLTAASWNGYVRANIEGNNLVTYIQ